MTSTSREKPTFGAMGENEPAESPVLVPSIYRQPVLVLRLFCEEVMTFLRFERRYFTSHKTVTAALILIAIGLVIQCTRKEAHPELLQVGMRNCLYYARWILLGVLSSVGLGCGVHTFLLYLGPFISTVTLAAWECNSVNFASPPYPDAILCPSSKGSSDAINIWVIISKVKWEAFMWGFGTAIGEVPPYFMGLTAYTPRAADGSSLEPSSSYVGRIKIYLERIVNNLGFVGVMLCASFPNPFYDFVGIMCGISGVPFSSFFIATFIGKALVKPFINSLFVIICFSSSSEAHITTSLVKIPVIGKKMSDLFVEAVTVQKLRFHTLSLDGLPADSTVSWIFKRVVVFMLVYFAITSIDQIAKVRARRLRLISN